jgi:Carboxypeptidase regulatory-like domain
MSGPAIVTGVVRDSRGQGVPGARVFFVDSPVPVLDIAALSDASGRFTLPAPAAGRYRVRGVLDDGGSVEIQIEVRGGEQEVVELRMP